MTYATSIHPPRAPGSRYDAIVIGAGLSGLTAAAYLAQTGARVLVCEQAEQVGGLFNSFRRGGYQFDGGIKAAGSSAVMLPMLAQLGLLERVLKKMASFSKEREKCHACPSTRSHPTSAWPTIKAT
jgi:phytoene dehydrogenase-like protein